MDVQTDCQVHRLNEEAAKVPAVREREGERERKRERGRERKHMHTTTFVTAERCCSFKTQKLDSTPKAQPTNEKTDKSDLT